MGTNLYSCVASISDHYVMGVLQGMHLPDMAFHPTHQGSKPFGCYTVLLSSRNLRSQAKSWRLIPHSWKRPQAVFKLTQGMMPQESAFRQAASVGPY